jgi:hypothetical protein
LVLPATLAKASEEVPEVKLADVPVTTVTVAFADLEVSATLLAVTVTAARLGTACGAV